MNDKKLPIWKQHPCASWCVSKHADGDPVEDRVCFGGYQVIGRTLADAVQVGDGWQLEELRVALESDFRELIPHLTVSYGSGLLTDPDSGAYNLTIEEAEELAGVIVGSIADARLSASKSCPAWCTSEHTDADGRAARSCVGAEHRVDLSLEDTLHSGGEWFLNTVHVSIERGMREIEARVLLYLGTGSGLELTLTEAEEFAATLLKLAGGALGAGAPYVEAKVMPPVAVRSKFGSAA